MLMDPNIAINAGWLTWDHNRISAIDNYVQPNAIDFDCVRLFELDKTSPALLSETKKVHRKSTELTPVADDDGELFWTLKQGKCYDFVSGFHVELPRGVAGELIIRSTLNRSGVFLTAGLYDSGFKGNVAGVLHVRGGDFKLAQYTRIGQLKLLQSDSTGMMYTGGYNNSSGAHWNSN